MHINKHAPFLVHVSRFQKIDTYDTLLIYGIYNHVNNLSGQS